MFEFGGDFVTFGLNVERRFVFVPVEALDDGLAVEALSKFVNFDIEAVKIVERDVGFDLTARVFAHALRDSVAADFGGRFEKDGHSRRFEIHFHVRMMAKIGLVIAVIEQANLVLYPGKAYVAVVRPIHHNKSPAQVSDL